MFIINTILFKKFFQRNFVIYLRITQMTENLMKKVYPNLSGGCINRAHRIGPDYACYKLLEKCRSILVRFVSFKHQTFFTDKELA